MVKKTSKYIISIIISLMVYIFINYILNSMFYALLVSLTTFVLSMIIFKIYYEREKMIKRLKSVKKFVNLLDLYLLDNDYYFAYSKTIDFVDDQFSSMEQDDYLIILQEIALDFKINSFIKYVETLKVANENNTNLDVLKIPLNNINNDYYFIEKDIKTKNKIFISITLIYLLYFAIFVFFKICLNDIYSMMINETVYQFIYFLLIEISIIIYFFIAKLYLKSKERWKDEKQIRLDL